jgi:hypothetical protein
MLRALQLKDAYNVMPDMDGMKMDEVDWLIIGVLARLLGTFDMYTKVLSGSTYPTINQVMPIFQRLLQAFESVQQIQGMLFHNTDFHDYS